MGYFPAVRNERNEMREIQQLANDLTNYSGDASFAEFVNGASPNDLVLAKLFIKNVKNAANTGNDLQEVRWRMSVSIENTDTIAQEFYLSPGMLATIGDNGVFKGTGVTFTGIAAVVPDKLKATVLTVLPAVFYRWLYQYPSYAAKITIAASAQEGIQNGYVKHAVIDPQSDTGVTSYNTLLLANYNLSESYQDTKAEIFDQNLYLSEQNVLKANVVAAQSISYTLDIVSFVPKIYANAFAKVM